MAEEVKLEIHPAAYVTCSRGLLDNIENTLNGFAAGDGDFCTNLETVVDYINGNDDDEELRSYLSAVVAEIDGQAGDVIFHL